MLNRHRSTTQQPGAELYDQMVARRLVSAIAAWHDLHASLLQLSLRTTDDDEGGETAADGDRRLLSAKRVSRVSSRASSICSTAGGGKLPSFLKIKFLNLLIKAENRRAYGEWAADGKEANGKRRRDAPLGISCASTTAEVR